MEDKDFYKVLVDRYVARKLTDDELEVFIALAQDGKLDDELMLAMTEVIESPELADTNAQPKVYRLWPRIAVVAAAVTAIVFGIWFFSAPRHPDAGQATVHTVQDVAPGKNTATLTLPNGKTINLSDAKTGVVVNANEMKYNDGSLVQGASGTHFSGSLKGDQKNTGPVSAPSLGVNEMLTASTPRGGTYQFTLPDGTKVWLNAASKISFPTQFSEKTRKILLSGEGYFEVAKDRQHPFKVQTVQQEVTVLGTHFNINAYDDEHVTKTTLLEGSVRLNGKLILKPGEQAQQSRLGIISVKQVDTSAAVDWKNGDFVFRKESLAEIMKKVARWYDVDVIYDKGIDTEQQFGGKVSRLKNISAVLQIMESTEQVKFKIEGRKVYVGK